MIKIFDELGSFLRTFQTYYNKHNKNKYISKDYKIIFSNLKKIVKKITLTNSWFREEDLLITINQWGNSLKKEKLEYWINKYSLKMNRKSMKVLVIMAGNIPMVGFHDLLCVLISGHKIIIKLSEEDNLLIPFLCKVLIYKKPSLRNKIKFTKNIFQEEFDYVIASGNNNTARYFEYYFRKFPLLLRKGKTSIAVLQGNESEEELFNLNKDILTYSGKGCRNVGKIFIPHNYDINLILEKSYISKYIMKNYKYINNYKYYLSIYIMQKIPFHKNNFLLFKEEKNFHSPISVVYYEFYNNLNQLRRIIKNNNQHIQCVVSKNFLKEEICFGKTQYPKLEEYSDGIDTIRFLN
ncbi:acyl-CoA reductase [Blattabacterium cuenoti]|uniref:acyl-CoA reductase n=1 Tax=Blattabacterium cuenoti TaxID=1653831 RepID=UPI00163C44C6|nr:acyl-CoA reductase [Blattabacterium cuenoti]